MNMTNTRYILKTFVTGAVAALSLPISVANAQILGSDVQAQGLKNAWKVCNETSYVLNVATAMMVKGKLTPKGWTELRSGACFTETPLIGTPRYVYAESSSVHSGRIREWKGNVPLCAISKKDFAADATVSCALQDLDIRDYLQVDPSERQTTFIEPSGYRKKAKTAGLQRLLRDNGYKISRVDGISGRRTRQTLEKFLKDKTLPKTTSVDKQFKALIKAAGVHQESVGLKLCNESGNRVWIAVAQRKDKDWESRGWWPIEKDECERTITESLKKNKTHFFALQEQPLTNNEDDSRDWRLKTVVAKPEQFCVAEGIFSALGQEFCSDRGYTPVSFRPIITDAAGITIKLTATDFVKSSQTGLRH